MRKMTIYKWSFSNLPDMAYYKIFSPKKLAQLLIIPDHLKKRLHIGFIKIERALAVQ